MDGVFRAGVLSSNVRLLHRPDFFTTENTEHTEPLNDVRGRVSSSVLHHF
jgi:hypothetical protein